MTSGQSDTSASSSRRRARIVVVDDSRTQLAILRQLLLEDGYEVVSAFDAGQALQMVADLLPDLVIADTGLPHMDGYAMCQALKANPATAQTPVLLLTPMEGPADIVRVLQAGTPHYLTKPYDADYLLSTVEGVLSGSHKVVQTDVALEVEIYDHEYTVLADPSQMMGLLLATYDGAVQQHKLFMGTQYELRSLNEKLLGLQQQVEAQKRELSESKARLRDQAMHDVLTGLRNRRALNERFGEEADRARRRSEPLSLALLDVDHFKAFNDSFGHAPGDSVLQQVAALLEKHARISDIVARYGGEEFVLVLPATDAESARLVAERVRHAVESAVWSHRPVTVSIGLSTFTQEELQAYGRSKQSAVPSRRNGHIEPANELTLLLDRADEALYASKRRGRNRFTHSNDLPTGEGI